MSNQKEIKELQEQLWRLVGILTGASEPENEGLLRLRRELARKLSKGDPADAEVEAEEVERQNIRLDQLLHVPHPNDDSGYPYFYKVVATD
jgi:hypothetical protein